MLVTFEQLKETFDRVFVSAPDIAEDSTYLDVAEWDSVAHVTLILALQEKYGVEIPLETAVELNSVAKILEYLNSSVKARC